MATEILSTVGRAAGGPVVGTLGAFAGRVIDGAISGSPSSAALMVQSAAYGEAIPRLYGTLRVSGGILWSTGLKREGAGLNKLSGGAGQSYSTSIAIGLCARAIQDVGRIWADGKLIRDASGLMSVAGALRIYKGTEAQQPDPLIIATEGLLGAPAYRGLAYVVFETLGLAEFADRVPQFAFEIFADPAAVTLGAVASDLFAAANAAVPDTGDLSLTVQGYGVGAGADLGGALSQIALLQPHDPLDEGDYLRLRVPDTLARLTLSAEEAGTSAGGRSTAVRIWHAGSARAVPVSVEIAYFDPARDFQPGLQISSAAGAVKTIERHDLPAALPSFAARTLAERRSRELQAATATRTVELPYARLNLEVGDALAIEADPRLWRVRRRAIDGMVVLLELEAWPSVSGVAARGDAGRSNANPLTRQGPTLLRVLDLPGFGDGGGSAPRLWLALGGDGNWRAAQLLASTDAGASYASLGVARTRAVIGTTTTTLAPGACDRWDRLGSVEVKLANSNDTLLSATEDMVLAGGNLAYVGGELIQFQNADAVGAGRFRLSTLLRGRFGTEFTSAGHVIGEDFVLVDQTAMFRAETGLLPLGASALIKAVGPLDAPNGIVPARMTLRGANLRPFAPTHLRTHRDTDGTIELNWTRRSRLGFDWLDGADAPLAEDSERYLVTLTPMSGPAQTYVATQEQLQITPAQQMAQTGALVGAAVVSIAQVSAAVGPGPPAVASL